MLGFVLCVSAVGLPRPAEAQQVVGGTVVEAETQRPLAGAHLIVKGTNLGGLARANGRFLIVDVPAGSGGQVELEVGMIGYRTMTQTVRVGEVNLLIELATQAISLDEVVVTGTAGGSQVRAIGNAVTALEMQDVIERRAPESIQSLLTVEVPGLTIRSVGGEIGSGGSMKIRGAGSLALSNEPMIFVDGVRVDNRDNPLSAAFVNRRGGPSRLNDLALSDIEKIEIVKGPAAATLYGTEASNGVIQIFTKRGSQGAPQIEVAIKQGASFLYNAEEKYPLVWARDPQTGELVSANLVALEEARGTPIFTTGQPRSVFAGISGGLQNLRYYFSADMARDEGIVDYQWQNKFAGRSNLSYTTEKFEAGVNMGFVRQSTHTSGREQAVTFQVMWGSPLTIDSRSRGLLRNAHEDYNQLDGLEEVDRFTGGIYLRHSPFEWLNHQVRVGGDFGNTRSFSLWPRTAQQPGPFGRSIGQKDIVQDRTNFTSISYTVNAPLHLTSDVSLESSSGIQYYEKQTQLIEASGIQFPVPGVSTVSAAAQHLSEEDFIENKTFGVYLQERIGWKNRVFLTAAIRGDDNSAFGENYDFVTYPKLSASWVVSEEPFWNLSWIDALKLRAAWGKAGQQPDVFAASRLYAPATGPGGAPTLSPSNIGNPDLRPEVGEEIELGFDAALIDQRVSLEFTYFDQHRTDAIVPRSVLPSLGFPGIQFVNIGEVSNKGFEVGTGVQLIRAADWDLDFSLNYSHTKNRVVDLGGVTPPVIGLSWPGQRHVEGYPVAGLFMKKVVSAEFDANGDLINVMCEGGDRVTGGGPPVPCAEAGTAYWGQPEPSWDFGATATLRFRDLSLSATADGQGGYIKCNGDIAWAHVFFRNTRAIHERKDPILAAYDQMGAVCQAGTVNSGFAKLRDLSLRYELPALLTEVIGAATASVTLNAQNMFTLWQATKSLYGAPVIDPEVHSNLRDNGIGDLNAYTQDLWPQVQRINVILRATF